MKKLIQCLSFLCFLVSFGYSQSSHFKYEDTLSDQKYIITIGSSYDDDVRQISDDSIAMRNRIYIDVDSTGNLYLNSHLIPIQEFEQHYRYVLNNPEQLDHLPESTNAAVIYFNLMHDIYDKREFSNHYFQLEFLMTKINSVTMDLMLYYLEEELKTDWTVVDEGILSSFEVKYAPKIALASSIDHNIDITSLLESENTALEEAAERNMLHVFMSGKNELSVRGKQVEVEQLSKQVKAFIQNPDGRSNLAESPQQAVVYLIKEQGTIYGHYLAVYNEIKQAYDELWEEEAQTQFGKSYADVNQEEKRVIRTTIPFMLVEPEPNSLGEDKRK